MHGDFAPLTPLAVHRSLLVLFTGLVLAGCVGVFQPYIKIKTEIKDAAPNSFSGAVAYADNVRAQYRKALGNQAKLRIYGGLTMIGLATSTIGLGAAGVSGDEILVTGLTGTALFSGSSYLSSTPRQQAYIMGYNAVTCVVEVIRPLHFQDKDLAYQRFRSAIDSKLSEKITKTSRAIDELSDELTWARADSTNLPNVVKAEYEEALRNARTAVADARAAHQHGSVVYGEIQDVSAKLADAIDKIVGEVDTAVVQTIPGLPAVAATISQLGDIYGRFTKVPENFKSIDAETDVGPQSAQVPRGFSRVSELRAKYLKLSEARTEMATSAREVNDFIAALKAKQPDKTLGACGVDPSAIVTAIELSESTLEFAHGSTVERLVEIAGGTAPYSVTPGGEVAGGISAKIPYPNAPLLQISISAEAAPGEYSVGVVDSSGERTDVLHIEIVRKPNNGVNPPDKTDEEQAAIIEAVEEAFIGLANETDRKLVQEVACMRLGERDGEFGPKTSAQILRSVPNLTKDTAAEAIAGLLREPADKDSAMHKRCADQRALDFEAILESPLLDTSFDVTAGSGDSKTTLGMAIQEAEPADDNQPPLELTLKVSTAASDLDALSAEKKGALAALSSQDIIDDFLVSRNGDDGGRHLGLTLALNSVKITNIEDLKKSLEER